MASVINWLGNTSAFISQPRFELTTTKEKSSLVQEGQMAGFSTGAWKAYVPGLYSRNPTYPEYGLEQAAVERLDGDIARITLSYAVYSQQGENVPAPTISETANEVQVSIKVHPKYASWVSAGLIDATTGLFSKTSGKYGEDYFIVGSKEITYTQYFEDDPGEAVLDGIGLIVVNMPGGYDGSGNNYLLTSATKAQQGQYWVLTQNIRYSSVPWDSDIYTAGS